MTSIGATWRAPGFGVRQVVNKWSPESSLAAALPRVRERSRRNFDIRRGLILLELSCLPRGVLANEEEKLK